MTVNFQTNLIIKGIIAIEAVSKMSSIVNNANKYSVRAGPLYTMVTLICLWSAAASAYGQWKSGGLSSDQHLLAVYKQIDSWTLGYNLFADVWLGTSVVESSVGVSESRFLPSLIGFRYITGKAVSLTISRRTQPSATLACLLITFFRTRVSLCPVGNSIIFTFYWLNLF